MLVKRDAHICILPLNAMTGKRFTKTAIMKIMVQYVFTVNHSVSQRVTVTRSLLPVMHQDLESNVKTAGIAYIIIRIKVIGHRDKFHTVEGKHLLNEVAAVHSIS